MATEKVRLTGEKATMLATLYGRAIETTFPDPIIVDPMALAAVRKLDFNFRTIKLRHDDPHSIAIRAKLFDELTTELLAAHPGASVLHLGCGLDSRVFRIDVPAGTTWFDVDFPEVVDLRKQVYPDPDVDYHLVASSVTDLAWLEKVPADRPVVVVAEGLVPYLEEKAGIALFTAIAARFPAGEAVFDAWTRTAVKLRKLQPAVRQAGADMGWGIDDPRELELAIPGFTFVDAPNIFHQLDVEKLSAATRAAVSVPFIRKMSRVLHYRFTRPPLSQLEKVALTGEKSTLLLTLYARALDAVSDHPLLGDRTALDVLQKLDVDQDRIRLGTGDDIGTIIRARELDRRTIEFLRDHPDGTVLHLACGLDSRALRIDRPASSRWFDVDYPEVADLRRKLYPEPSGNYRLIGSSVADHDFLREVPDDQPVLVLAEGLTQYLTEEVVVGLFAAATRRFRSGVLLFDACAKWVVKVSRYSPPLKQAGTSFGWGIDDPHELEELVPGIRFADEWFLGDDPDLAHRSVLALFLFKRIRALSRSLRLLEYRF
ncbi:class I SAM-dependent methyltransferase [Fodinicola acaciae]|uniref:class I SAM-dependent methyltransferase n=1 Tax=Fodinicola acaciae TaxID=2681555 RepID=UPI0013D4483B|nr:class I SAM-dependent methyltransferase [Fodinicola acaciae]